VPSIPLSPCVGLIRLKVAKHIFQGPSAALEAAGYHRGKQGIASLIHITSMDPHLIAYIAVQVCDLKNSIAFHLSFHRLAFPFRHPNNGRNSMDRLTMANFIGISSGYLMTAKDRRSLTSTTSESLILCIDIYLDAVCSHIFGRPLGASAMPGTASTPPVESDFDRLKVQRAARRAQAVAATGEADA
jgi:hypothetical protein